MNHSNATLGLLATLAILFAAPWSGGTTTASAQEAAAAAPTCFDANDQPTCPAEQMQADVTRLGQAYARLHELTRGARHRLQEGMLSLQVDDVRATVLIMLEVNGLVRHEVGPFFAEFTQRYGRAHPNYGSDEPAIQDRLDSFDRRVNNNFLAMREMLRQIAVAGSTSARVCMQAETFQLAHMNRINPMLRGRVMNKVQALLEICPQFDPDNEDVRQQVEQLRPQVAALLQQYAQEEFEAARGHRWEASVARVNGAAASGLERAALAYLRGHESWGGTEGTQVMAVSVRGDWSVARRNILGQPAQWGLPVQVAIIKSDTHAQLAQVFELTLVTPSAQRQGRFQEYWVGNTWNVLRSALPRGRR